MSELTLTRANVPGCHTLSALPLVASSVLILFGGQVERTALEWKQMDPLLTQPSLLRA